MWSPPHTPLKAGEGPAGLPLQRQLAKTVLRTYKDCARPNGRNMIDSVLSPFRSQSGQSRCWFKISHLIAGPVSHDCCYRSASWLEPSWATSSETRKAELPNPAVSAGLRVRARGLEPPTLRFRTEWPFGSSFLK